MAPLSIIYLMTLLMLSLYHRGYALRGAFVPRNSMNSFSFHHQKLKESFKQKKMADLLIAYNTGNKRKIGIKIKKAHRRLHLLHLFTPSGIHLSALYLFLIPLFYWVKKRNRLFFEGFWLATALLPFCLSGLYSIKRMALFRILWHIGPRMTNKLTCLHIFFITFLFDFLFGNFKNSPLSFIYSFLFLGIIVTTSLNHGRPLIALLGGQIIIGFFDLRAITHLGFIFGVFLTGLFSLFFPLFFLFYWSFYILPLNWGEPLIHCYWYLVNISSKIAYISGSFYSSLPLVFTCVLLAGRIKKRKKRIIFIFFLMIHSNPVFNLPHSAYMKKGPNSYYLPPISFSNIKKINRTRRGYKITFKNQYYCYDRIYGYFFERTCK